MRRAARVDGNHKALRKAWEFAGGSWCNIAAGAGGEPDAVIGRGGMTWLIEVKDGSKAPSERKLRQNQVDWHAAWCGAPVILVTGWPDLARLVVASDAQVERNAQDRQPGEAG